MALSAQVLLVTCMFVASHSWSPAIHWKLVCTSGTPSAWKWSLGIELFRDKGCSSSLSRDIDRVHGDTYVPDELLHQCIALKATEKHRGCSGTRTDTAAGDVCCHHDVPSSSCKGLNVKNCRCYFRSYCVLWDDSLKSLWSHDRVSWTSTPGSKTPAAAKVAVQFRGATEVNCVKLYQHKDSFCPKVSLLSADGHPWSSWWQVETSVENVTGNEHKEEDVFEQRFVQRSQDLASDDVQAYHQCSALPPQQSGHLWSAAVRGSSFSFLSGLALIIVLCVAALLSCIAVLSSCEAWIEIIDIGRPRFVPRSTIVRETFLVDLNRHGQNRTVAAERSPGAKLFRLKIVCQPRWFLSGTTLSNAISHSCPELRVLGAAEAGSELPGGPLRDFEAVVEVPSHMSNEYVGRVLMMMLERRCREVGADLTSRARMPRFQSILFTRWGVLYLGGSICCGTRRWRSCPARVTME